MMDIRTQVINELTRRLKVGFDNILVFQGDAEVWGKWQRDLPCIHLFELPTRIEKLEQHGRGKHICVQIVQIEYIHRFANKIEIYNFGRALLDRIRRVVELDERFKELAGQVDVGNDLVIDYGLSATEITVISPTILDIALAYEFRFKESFYGYERDRH